MLWRLGGRTGSGRAAAPGRRRARPARSGKMRLSAEFIVKRMTRPFGTFGFSVNAGSGT